MKIIYIIVLVLMAWNGYSQKVRQYLPPETFYNKIIVDTSHFNFDADSLVSFKFRANYGYFESVSISDIEDNWLKYKNKIIEISKTKHFDSQSLIKAFDIIKNERTDLALLPISVFLAKKGMTNVWVIICMWEIKRDLIVDPVVHYYGCYCHIRQWAIDTESYKVIGFSTCQ